ncbi:hypothetical protein RUM44_013311 [Polyplax serrata]|uniref:CHK kinase-like domain-containing protein n=1 Tax=Polyplax serrata TaxID=468196 RepID=A0ABR1BDU2_POLSC
MLDLNKDEVVQVLRNYLGGEVQRVTNFEVEEQSEHTIGYLGNHLALTVDYILNQRENRKRFFVKTHDKGDRDASFLDDTGIFQKEVDFYMVIVEEIRKSVGEPNWCPRHCFNKKRILVLDDLTEKGFAMAEGDITLEDTYVKLALKTLARMHASSMLLERIKTKPLATVYPELFREVLYDEAKPRSPTSRWITWQVDDLLLGIDYLDKYTHQQKEYIKANFASAIRRIYPLNKQSTRFCNVLTHGDIWKNNLMFRFEGDTPVDCRLVDFQFFRYAPPAHDVMNFLHFATLLEDRDKNKSLYLDLYYDSLRKEFESRGMLVQDQLSKEEFLESCEIYKELGVIQSLLSMHYILGPVTLEFNIDNYDKYEEYLANNRKDYMKKFFEMETYTNKITETLCEFIDNYIMKS